METDEVRKGEGVTITLVYDDNNVQSRMHHYG